MYSVFDSFLAGLDRNRVYCACCSAQTAQAIEQFKPVQQSRQQEQRAYCPSVYAVFKHLFPATFGTGPLQQVTLLEKKFVIVSMYWI